MLILFNKSRLEAKRLAIRKRRYEAAIVRGIRSIEQQQIIQYELPPARAPWWKRVWRGASRHTA